MRSFFINIRKFNTWKIDGSSLFRTLASRKDYISLKGFVYDVKTDGILARIGLLIQFEHNFWERSLLDFVYRIKRFCNYSFTTK